jgi:hypothetical protein
MLGERRNVNSKQVEPGSGRSTRAPDDSPRLRFAKREIQRALLALEAVDRDQFDAHMRLLETEDRLADAREDARRWREAYEAMCKLAANPERLDELLREWVGKA